PRPESLAGRRALGAPLALWGKAAKAAFRYDNAHRLGGRRMAKAAAKATAKSGSKPKADKAELLRFYREMLLIRRFEERAGQLYGMGLIGGFCHLYIGQEAVAVGAQASFKPG